MRFCLITQLVGSTEVVEDECDNTARIKLLSVISVRSLFLCIKQLIYWHKLEGKTGVLSSFFPSFSIQTVILLGGQASKTLKGSFQQESDM